MKNDYGGVIWTKHALQRLKERNIKQGDAWVTWRRPDQSRYAESKEAWIYHRTFGDQKIEVVAKKNEKGVWIFLSVWSRKVRITKSKSKKSLVSKIFGKVFSKNKI